MMTKFHLKNIDIHTNNNEVLTIFDLFFYRWLAERQLFWYFLEFKDQI